MDWISVNDRLPEQNCDGGTISKKVLVIYGRRDKQRLFGWYQGGTWLTEHLIPYVKQDHITHWMPLPEPPK